MIFSPTTKLLTLAEVAGEVHVAKSTVGEWVYQEECLASFRKGSIRRVSLENLTRFVILNTLNPRRPEWMTAAVQTEFEKRLEEIAGRILERRLAVIGERKAA